MSLLTTIYFIVFIVLFLYIYPLIVIFRSTRVHGIDKVVWFMLTLLFSWIAFAMFLAYSRGNIYH